MLKVSSLPIYVDVYSNYVTLTYPVPTSTRQLHVCRSPILFEVPPSLWRPTFPSFSVRRVRLTDRLAWSSPNFVRLRQTSEPTGYSPYPNDFRLNTPCFPSLIQSSSSSLSRSLNNSLVLKTGRLLSPNLCSVQSNDKIFEGNHRHFIRLDSLRSNVRLHSSLCDNFTRSTLHEFHL